MSEAMRVVAAPVDWVPFGRSGPTRYIAAFVAHWRLPDCRSRYCIATRFTRLTEGNYVEQNPYLAPASSGSSALGVKSGRREDLRAVATYQKGILACIAIYIMAMVGQFLVPEELRLLIAIGVVGVGVVGTVFVFLLATKVYATGVGILLGILTLIPCLGLIVLLIINSRATAILKQNGISVGLFGANMSQLN